MSAPRLRLWLLRPRLGPSGRSDEVRVAVVRAVNARHAREIMTGFCGSEGAEPWRDPRQTVCAPLLECPGPAGLIVLDQAPTWGR